MKRILGSITTVRSLKEITPNFVLTVSFLLVWKDVMNMVDVLCLKKQEWILIIWYLEKMIFCIVLQPGVMMICVVKKVKNM